MAYGSKGERNGLHSAGKHQHGWWCWDSDWIAIGKIAESLGVGSVTGLLHGIANGAIAVGHSKKSAEDTLAAHGVKRGAV